MRRTMSAESPSLQESVSIATDNDAPALPPEDHPSDAPPRMNGSSKASSFTPPPPPPPPPDRSVGGDGDQDDTAAIAAAPSAQPPPPLKTTTTTTTTKASAKGARQRRHHRNNHRRSRVDPSSRRGGDGRRSVALSGGSPADNDASYCTEIARRSVARAALHLGMEGMEGEALDVLGSVLLGYMEMVRFMLSRFGDHWGLLAVFCYFVRTLAPMAFNPPPLSKQTLAHGIPAFLFDAHIPRYTKTPCGSDGRKNTIA